VRKAQAAQATPSHATCLPMADATRPEKPFSFSKKISAGVVPKNNAKGFLAGFSGRLHWSTVSLKISRDLLFLARKT